MLAQLSFHPRARKFFRAGLLTPARVAFGAALAVWLFVWPAAGAAQTIVRVAAESTVERDQIMLGDIAEVQAADEEEAGRLRAVGFGYAPRVGAVREIMRDRVVRTLQAAGYGENTVRLSAPAVAIVRRAAQRVERKLIAEAVEQGVLSELRAQGVRANLTKLELPELIEVPTGRVEVRASTGAVRNLFAPFPVFVEVLIENRVERRLTATTRIEAWAAVAVARRDLTPGVRLREEDFVFAERSLDRPLAKYVREARQLRGMSLRRPLGRDQALTTELLNADIVVKPGDAVNIVGEAGGVRIAVAGEARAAGRVGDRIQVRNTASGASLQATVVDEGEVRVKF